MGIFMTALFCAVIFVNGATDAPNSISGSVATGAQRYKSAVALCALFNFLGLVLSCVFFPSVAESVVSLDSGGGAVPLVTVVIFASLAWVLGVPTSESYALVAAMGGVSLYTQGVTDAAFEDICIKSILSCALAFGAGAVITLSMHLRGKTMHFLQRTCAAMSSACHGMQDGQKFTAALLCAAGKRELSASCVLLCGAVMAFGCLFGGKRITEAVGRELVMGECFRHNAMSDLAAVICTLGATVCGIPVSTTYMKSCALLGSAAATGTPVNKSTVGRFILTWALTYPVCMALGYSLSFITGHIF